MSTDADEAALSRSRAVDLICRTLTFTNWTRQPEEEVDRVAVRLLEHLEKLLTA